MIAEAESPIRPAPVATRAVLVADDEEAFLQATCEQLRRVGFVCDCARDAHEALVAANLRNYDVLVTDINMPGNENLEMVAEFQRRHRGVPVILVTAYPSVATAVDALRYTAVDYLIKPFDFDELRGRIEQAITMRDFLRMMVEMKQLLGSVTTGLDRLEAGAAQLWRGALDAPPAATGDAGGAAAEQGAKALESLSDREREIVRAVLAGRRAAVIAGMLGITESTVRNHLKNVFRKLGVHSQLELVSRLRPLVG